MTETTCNITNLHNNLHTPGICVKVLNFDLHFYIILLNSVLIFVLMFHVHSSFFSHFSFYFYFDYCRYPSIIR